MNKVAVIIAIIGMIMILLGIVLQYIDYECQRMDKNIDFWVKNCEYK